MGDVGHGRDVEHHHAGVAQRFGKHGARVGADGGGEGVGVRRVDEAGVDAELLQVDGEHGHAAAVERAGRDHMVAGLQQRGERERFGRHAAGGGHGGAAALQGGHAFFERRDGGVGEARVDVAEGLQVEQTGGVFGAVEDEAGGLVDRQGARAGGGIGDLAGVDGERFGLKVAVGHGVSPALAGGPR
ncbi:hypothetical protein FQZ97_1012060 [compost metagenome]